LKKIGPSAVEPLIAKLREPDPRGGAGEAALILGDLGDARAVEPLIAALRVPYGKVSEGAVAALGKLGDPRACEPLAQMLKMGSVKYRAARALGRCGPNGLEPLVAALKDKDAELRCPAAEGLGAMRDKRAVGPLVLALMDKRSRPAVCTALVQVGTPAVEPLIGALNDKDKEVRTSAAGVLGELGDKQAVVPLVACLQDADRDVRMSAVSALGQLGDMRAVEPLIGALRNTNPKAVVDTLKMIHPDPVQALVAALGKQISHSQTPVPPVGETARNSRGHPFRDYGPRAAVALALGLLGDRRGVGPLVLALEDSDAEVRTMAANALGQLCDGQALEPLILALKDPDREVRAMAAEALGLLHDKRALAPLLAALRDKEWEVQDRATKALGELGDVRAVDPLVGVLQDPDLSARAARSLGKLKDKRATSALIKELQYGGHGGHRAAAAWALGELGDRRGVEPLVSALKDPERLVREEAAKALEKLRTPTVIARGNVGREESEQRLAVTEPDKAGEQVAGALPEPAAAATNQPTPQAEALDPGECSIELGTCGSDAVLELWRSVKFAPVGKPLAPKPVACGTGSCKLGDKQFEVKIVDANANAHLGDRPHPLLIDGRPVAMFGGDMLLVSTTDPRTKEKVSARACYGHPVFLGGKGYDVRISSDGKKLRLSESAVPAGRIVIGHERWSALLVGRKHVLSLEGSSDPVDVPSDQYVLFEYVELAPVPVPRPGGGPALTAIALLQCSQDNALYDGTAEVFDITSGKEVRLAIGSPLSAKLTASEDKGLITLQVSMTDSSRARLWTPRVVIPSAGGTGLPAVSVLDADGKILRVRRMQGGPNGTFVYTWRPPDRMAGQFKAKAAIALEPFLTANLETEFRIDPGRAHAGHEGQSKPVAPSSIRVPSSLSESRHTKHFTIYTNLDKDALDYYEHVLEGFIGYFESNYFTVEQQQPLNVFLFKDNVSFQEYVRTRGGDLAGAAGFYTREENLVVINRQSGLGTATHEIVHFFIESAFVGEPPRWVMEGFAAFFEKFIGHLDPQGNLTISFGYFSNWRFPVTKAKVGNLSLRELAGARGEVDQCAARSLILFLHRKGRLKGFIDKMRVQTNDPDGLTTLQDIYGKDTTSIETEWKDWIQSQPIDQDVNLVESAFVKTQEEWDTWWGIWKDKLYWSEREGIYRTKPSP
jgi:HEAT repeat protein